MDIQGPPSQGPVPDLGGGIRREVAGMSSASRLRFKERLAQIRCEEMTNALTVCLTFPRGVVKSEEWQVYKNHLRRFNQEVHRKYKGCSGVWVLEFHKSGAPHFHLLVFGVRHIEIDALREWMQARWYSIAHNGDKHQGKAGTCIEWAKHGGGVMGYIAKYMSKSNQNNRGAHTGRMWGKFGTLPLGEPETPALTEHQIVKVRRWGRKLMEKHVNASRWKNFLDGKNPREPPPDHRVVMKNPRAMGGREYWEKAKSAFHGGAKGFDFLTIDPPCEVEGMMFAGGLVKSRSSARVVDQCRPPGKRKARCNDRVRLICNADAFMAAVYRGAKRGLL